MTPTPTARIGSTPVRTQVQTQTQTAFTYYTVKPKESLWSIAQRECGIADNTKEFTQEQIDAINTDIAKIKQQNKLKTDTLIVGQSLKLNKPVQAETVKFGTKLVTPHKTITTVKKFDNYEVKEERDAVTKKLIRETYSDEDDIHVTDYDPTTGNRTKFTASGTDGKIHDIYIYDPKTDEKTKGISYIYNFNGSLSYIKEYDPNGNYDYSGGAANIGTPTTILKMTNFEYQADGKTPYKKLEYDRNTGCGKTTVYGQDGKSICKEYDYSPNNGKMTFYRQDKDGKTSIEKTMTRSGDQYKITYYNPDGKINKKKNTFWSNLMASSIYSKNVREV